MRPTLPPMQEALSVDDIVVLRTGTSETAMSLRVIENPHSIASVRWSQPIPNEMGRPEAEYYALIKGLRKAIDMGYSKAVVNTYWEPIAERLQAGHFPTDERREFHESVVQLVEQFDEIDINPKPWRR